MIEKGSSMNFVSSYKYLNQPSLHFLVHELSDYIDCLKHKLVKYMLSARDKRA